MLLSYLPVTVRSSLEPDLNLLRTTPCGLRLKHIGTLIAQRRMPPLVIVSHFEVVDAQCGGLRPRVSGG